MLELQEHLDTYNGKKEAAEQVGHHILESCGFYATVQDNTLSSKGVILYKEYYIKKLCIFKKVKPILTSHPFHIKKCMIGSSLFHRSYGLTPTRSKSNIFNAKCRGAVANSFKPNHHSYYRAYFSFSIREEYHNNVASMLFYSAGLAGHEQSDIVVLFIAITISPSPHTGDTDLIVESFNTLLLSNADSVLYCVYLCSSHVPPKENNFS